MSALTTTGRAVALLGVAAAGTVAVSRPVDAQVMKYPSPSGKISYTIKSAMMSGSQVMMWADGGTKVRTETDMNLTMQGRSMPMKTWSIVSGGFIYVFQPQNNQVMKIKAPKQAGPGMAMPGMGGPGGKGLQGGKVTGKETIAGKPCEIRQVSETVRVSSWKGMPLKMVVSSPQLGGTMTLEATKVESPAKVSPTAFKVPAGLKVVESKMPTAPGGMAPGAGGAAKPK